MPEQGGGPGNGEPQAKTQNVLFAITATGKRIYAMKRLDVIKLLGNHMEELRVEVALEAAKLARDGGAIISVHPPMPGLKGSGG